MFLFFCFAMKIEELCPKIKTILSNFSTQNFSDFQCMDNMSLNSTNYLFYYESILPNLLVLNRFIFFTVFKGQN